MKIESNFSRKFLFALAAVVLLFSQALGAQDKRPDAKDNSDSASKNDTLTIIVTAGDDNKPVASASVYVRFVEARKLEKDKKIEMNLKTNLSGACHVPVLPPGKFMIQVIAPGWKTFGEYYDIGETAQTVRIHLVSPPKWY